MIEKRLLFGKYMIKLHQEKDWSVGRYAQKVIWADMCNDVLPMNLAKAIAQAQTRQGGSAWYSQDCATNTENLRGKKEDLKLAGSGTVRLHWMPVLTMGKVHVEILGSGFAADRPESMATFFKSSGHLAPVCRRKCTREYLRMFLPCDAPKGIHTVKEMYWSFLSCCNLCILIAVQLISCAIKIQLVVGLIHHARYIIRLHWLPRARAPRIACW